jgi:uncharacterized protein with PQ loop repeat
MSITLGAILGLLATVVSTGILLPTLIQQIRTRKPGKIEPMLLAQALLANLLWIAYGGVENDLFVFGRALIAGIISGLTIYLNFKFR